MKVLELFSGTECMSNAFRARGHECHTVDWEEKFPSTLHIGLMPIDVNFNIDEYANQLNLFELP